MDSNHKTALVLAGGGLTGAMYEIGALRAIEQVMVGRTFNDFDIYVGTSAGAIVTSLLANGMRVENLLDAVQGTHEQLPLITPAALFHLNYGGLTRWLLSLPRNVANTWLYLVRHLGDATLFDVLWTMGERFPAGVFDNQALENYLAKLFKTQNGTNDFRKLRAHLNIVATQLGTGKRAIFSSAQNSAVPISRAVAASTALPIVYTPVTIGKHDYVDGAARDNASLDVAIELGARLIVCVNPLVPFDHNGSSDKVNDQSLRRRGLNVVLMQLARINAHAGLQTHIKQLRRRHPEVDILLFEPRADDTELYFYNIMRYAVRTQIAARGYESVAADLAAQYTQYRHRFARHGIATRRPAAPPAARRRKRVSAPLAQTQSTLA